MVDLHWIFARNKTRPGDYYFNKEATVATQEPTKQPAKVLLNSEGGYRFSSIENIKSERGIKRWK